MPAGPLRDGHPIRRGSDTSAVSTLGPIVDCNVHLWDQRDNPVFWLTDRTLVRDLIGDYDSLPDVYTLSDYERETAAFDVRGIVWSDAGAADPVAAAEWVRRQDEERRLVTGIVSLGDPAAAGFGDLVDRLRRNPLVRSVRVRLAGGLVQGPQPESTLLEQPGVMEHLALLARHDLAATIEATSDQLSVVTRLTQELPQLRIVVDHFGWPTDLSDAGRRTHLDRLGELAASPNVASRLDAVGTIFGAWTTERIRPWLLAIVALFGPERCMLGSDLPIERLRSGFEPLYRAYDEIFAEHRARDREMLLRATAEQWYGAG
jgi:predicted TIM-barrel fold metal-dependent hydrolase